MQINHIQHKDIDYKRWDQCISTAVNHFIYAYSWYLDIVSPDWEALTDDNYDYVMPLPVKRRFYIPYLVQPFLTQQLGFFSSKPLTEEILQQFIKKIPYYSYELHLNEKIEHPEITLMPNYVLQLNKSYKETASKYSKNTQRNIDKAIKSKLKVIKESDNNTFMNFYQEISTHLKSDDFEIILKVLDKAKENNALEIYIVKNENNETCAALALLISSERLTYFLPASNAAGKKNCSMFFLVDELIKKYAGQNLIFDFEGSSIEGIARFYKGFGAENQPYYSIKKFRPSFLIGKI